MSQIADKLSKLVLFYKIILLSLLILMSGVVIVILVSPGRDLITIIREEVFKEVGIALIISGFAILFYEYFLRKNMMDLIEEFVKTNFIGHDNATL
jgi:glucan phosphoethanolaminetransferase (alkaline phosphatase superfamily)